MKDKTKYQHITNLLRLPQIGENLSYKNRFDGNFMPLESVIN